jgi:SAM-dependent methyltransferase
MTFSDLVRLVPTVGISGLLTIRKVHRDMIFYARGFMTSYVMIIFLKNGIISDIENQKGIDPRTYSKNRGFDSDVFQSLCDYLYSLRILDKDKSKLVLSKKGKRLSHLSVGLFDFLYAYSPIFHNLDVLLNKQETYGTKIVRHADYVARGSTAITRYLPFPAAKRLLQKHGYQSFLDLGCGDGAFLFYVCQDGCTGLGVDLAEQAIVSARKRALETGQSERLKFEVADIFHLEDIGGKAADTAQVISLMFVLHEFLYGGDQRVRVLLQDIRHNFPNSDLLVCELNECKPEYLRQRSTAICEHHLYHRLSHQGFATIDQWLRIFSECDYEVKDMVLYEFAKQAYFLLQPRSAH